VRPKVAGRVVIARSVPRFTGGVLRVQIEDVSDIDRASEIVGAMTLSGVSHDPGAPRETVVPFSLTPDRDVDPTRHYSLRASLEAGGPDGASALHLRTDQAYPVLTRGFGSDAALTLAKWTRRPRTRP